MVAPLVILAAAAFLASFWYGIQLLVLAFRKGALHGLAYLFVPFYALIFVVMNWDEAGKLFVRQVAGNVALVVLVFGGLASVPPSTYRALGAAAVQAAADEREEPCAGELVEEEAAPSIADAPSLEESREDIDAMAAKLDGWLASEDEMFREMTAVR